MSNGFNKMTTHTYTKDDILYELPYEPWEHIDPKVETNEDGTRTVRYAVLDECPEWEWEEGVRLLSHIGNGIPDFEDNEILFQVEKYEHGLVLYSLVGEGSAVDRQWDVSYRYGIIIPNDFTDPKEAARGILKEYTSYCNGDVYGIVECTYEQDPEAWELALNHPCHHEAYWGVYGTDYAEKCVETGEQ